MKLFIIQIGGYRVNSAKICIWFIAIKKPNILLNPRDIENILCSQYDPYSSYVVLFFLAIETFHGKMKMGRINMK